MKKIILNSILIAKLLLSFSVSAGEAAFSPDGKYMTGDWGGYRTRLQNSGYNVTLEYGSMVTTNVAGGYDRRHTARYSDQYIVGLDLDLEKILNIDDAEFKAALIDRNGRDLTQDRLQDPKTPVMGSTVQSNYGRGQTWHAAQFWYRQSWFNKKLDLKAGLMPVGEDFDNSGCFFQNLSMCGSLAGHGSGVWYNTPIGQWGARVKYSPVPQLYLQTAAFQYNPRYATRRGSFDLDGTGHKGYMYVAELGYLPTFGAEKLPGTWKIGGWYNTANASDVLDDDDGRPYVLSKNPARVRDGRYGGYVYLRQQVTRDSRHAGGLSLFWHLAANDRRTATMDYQTQIGAIYQGPFAARPQDFISLGLSKMHVNSRVARRARLLNELKGADSDSAAYTPVRKAEYAGELHYSAKVTPWFTLRPNIQFLIHPGGNEEIKDAWVIGSQVLLTF